MQQVLSDIFSLDIWEILALCFMLILLVIQLYFYIAYYRRPYAVGKKVVLKEEGELLPASKLKVSVIISSENEVIRLSKILPVILEQDYPDFEVVVINNGSTDETDDLIDSLKLQYSNLYCTYVPHSNDRDFGRRKLAFTLGAKAASGDVLLFTEPHSIPLSANWIKHMIAPMNETVDVVIGASHFTGGNKLFNRIACFDNHLFSMQYLSKALEGKPFTGVYRNVAFKKSLFFENKGFASHLSLENAEDVFINQIVTAQNTRVVLHPDSFTEAEVDNYSLWKRIKKNYSVARTSFKGTETLFFSIETTTRLLFYAAFVGLSVYSVIHGKWGALILAFLLLLIRLGVQLNVLNKGAGYFKSRKFYLSLILVDILQPLYNWSFRTRTKKIKGL